MKLSELRQLLNTYDQTFSVRKLLPGEPAEVKIIRSNLKQLHNQSDNYQLTESDIFKLLNQLPLQSNIEIITVLKNKVGSPLFLELFAVLSSAGLLNERNFPVLTSVSTGGQAFLHALFCSAPTECITLSAEVFATTLAMTYKINYSNKEQINTLIASLRLLNRKQLLTPTGLNLVTQSTGVAISLFDALTALVQSGCLNDTTLGYLSVCESSALHSIMRILNLLYSAKIAVDDALVKLICNNKDLNLLVEILTFLMAPDNIDGESVVMLLQQNAAFLIEKLGVFLLLQQHDMLDKKTVDFVCKHGRVFGDILKWINEKVSVKQNVDLIDHLVSERIDTYQMEKIIRYLNISGLLDQNSINLSILLFVSRANKTSSTAEIIQLFEILFARNIFIKKEQLSLILQNTLNASRLNSVTHSLLYSQLLSADSFEKAYERVTQKIPKTPLSEVEKKGRKKTYSARSELVLDHTTHVYVEQNELQQYKTGGCGQVKKGYATADANTPIYAIKKLNKSNELAARLEAAREVKYHQLLGRNAFYFFMNGKSRIISPWINEVALHLITLAELESTPFEVRIRCLKKGLSDLDKLHQHYRVHGDVKPANCIVDLNKGTMDIIDFGSTHKRGSFKSFPQTIYYADHNEPGDHFYKDIYSMGMVTAYLFPELNKLPKDPCVLLRAISMLKRSMQLRPSSARCTSAQALAYCEALLTNVNNLDITMLQDIAKATIYCKQITVEDVLREKVGNNYFLGETSNEFTM